MKKLISVLLVLACIASLAACGKKEEKVINLDEPDPVEVKDAVDESDTWGDIPDSDINDILDDIPDIDISLEELPEELSGESADVTLYFSSDDGTRFISYTTTLDSLSPDNVIAALINVGAIPSGSKISSYAKNEDSGKDIITLDMNSAFGKGVNSAGKFDGYMMVGSLVNTFIKAYDVDAVALTAGGKELDGYSGKLSVFGDNPNKPEKTEDSAEAETPVNETEDIPAAPAPTDDGSVAALAVSLEGSAYESNGVGPDTFDNSGFVYYCFKENGISVPRQTTSMYKKGNAVSADALEKGDVLFYDLDGSGAPTYAAIYIGGGKAVTCSVSSNCVTEIKTSVKWYADRYLGARRFT